VPDGHPKGDGNLSKGNNWPFFGRANRDNSTTGCGRKPVAYPLLYYPSRQNSTAPMSGIPFDRDTSSPAMEAHLLGRIDFGRCLALQQRLVRKIAAWGDAQVRLLLCEHPDVVTVGRGGSPAEIRRDSRLIRTGQIEVRWAKRGGGCLVHTPGQLAVYPILPLRPHGFSVGEYLERLQTGIANTLRELGIRVSTRPGQHGLWGRTGKLVAFGVAVRDWVTYHGAFVNVSPSLGLFRVVEAAPDPTARMSSLVAERQRPAKMTSVRAELIPRLAEAFGLDRYHIYSGHPWLVERVAARR